jgi:hypothetical protein
MNKRWLCLLVALFLFLFPSQGCGQKDPVERYENQTFGVQMELPAAWKGHYDIQEDDTPQFQRLMIGFLYPPSWWGILGWIEKRPVQQWEADGRGELIPTEYKMLGETDGYVYVLVFPGDVHYDPENAEQTHLYEEMRNDLLNTVRWKFS